MTVLLSRLTDALRTATSGVGVALVAGTALANGTEAAGEAVGVGSAREVCTGIVASEAVAARK